jgi:hypothetical protein
MGMAGYVMGGKAVSGLEGAGVRSVLRMGVRKRTTPAVGQPRLCALVSSGHEKGRLVGRHLRWGSRACTGWGFPGIRSEAWSPGLGMGGDSVGTRPGPEGRRSRGVGFRGLKAPAPSATCGGAAALVRGGVSRVSETRHGRPAWGWGIQWEEGPGLKAVDREASDSGA